MNENNALNDIILNKNETSNSNKKVILAVATLGVILIIVVMLMNSLTSDGTDNLPQAVLPPQPKASPMQTTINEEPLFEEVEVLQDEAPQNNLAAIAQKLKKESLEEKELVLPPKKALKVKKEVLTKKKETKSSTKSTHFTYYVQVGSFSKFEPNKKFLSSITKLGYPYKYHTVTVKSKSINKVLVGPFTSQKEAKDARRILRSKVEPGAFLFKL